MTLCRTVDEVRAAALADHDGPMSQDTADTVAAILTTAHAGKDAA